MNTMNITENQKIIETSLPGLLLIEPETHVDFRGDYVQVFRDGDLPQNHWLEECISYSKLRGTLRGIHADYQCNKLLSVFHGSVYYVIVACKPDDPLFGRWESFILSGENHYQLYKPARYGGALLALTDDVVFHYKQSSFYASARQVSIRYDDPRFNIHWPTGITPVLSPRDNSGALWELHTQ